MNGHDKLYSLTEDGFGIHTFELNYSSEIWTKFYAILGNVYSECQVYTINKNIAVIPKGHQGIRMYISRFDNAWNIKAIVTPRMLEPVHIESKSTQKRVDMRNNTHSFSVNSFYLIVF